MICELRIRGIGVIDDAVIEFSPGFTVVTGETGAGKTMVLTGLDLLRGVKADAGDVRTGASRAEVDGVWKVPAEFAQARGSTWADVGLEFDETDELILGRSVAAEGRSRAFLAGRVVPAATLEQISADLVAVHGQSDQVRVVDPRRQREMLDRFAETEAVRDAFADAFSVWRTTMRQIDELRTARADMERQANVVRLGIAEIEAVAPESGEDIALKARAEVLGNSSELVEQATAVRELIAGDDDSAISAVTGALRALERISAIDAQANSLVDQAGQVQQALQSLAIDVAAYLDGLDSDPEQLSAVQDRRQALSALMRKYGPTLDDVLDWWEQAQAQVMASDGADDRLVELQQIADTSLAEATILAGRLTAARSKAAARFSAAITEEMKSLAMPDAEVQIAMTTSADPQQWTVDGADTVDFLLRPHAGAAPRPLGQGASGGELSRVMLALEVSLAGSSPVPTFVFDEVDAGIGGKVAVEVGKRLSRLAQQSQVIVVTHLPQVAAFADRHVVVRKDRHGSVTSASVGVVEGAERVQEIVRMLSGLEDSASGAEHAQELLDLAGQARESPRQGRRTR